MKMKVEPDYAGMEIDCPGCNTKTKVPAESEAPEAPAPPPSKPKFIPTLSGGPSSSPPGSPPSPSAGPPALQSAKAAAAAASAPPPAPAPAPAPKIDRPPPPERDGWKESDPANPNTWVALGIGAGITVIILGLGFLAGAMAGDPPKGIFAFFYNLLLKRGWVNYAETIFFGWGLAILILKVGKLKHQRTALALDVLPVELGRSIDRDSVGSFIDYLYEQIPPSLRDSMMVNRIRKGLELFEQRQVNGDVSSMMDNQSGIDSTRIAGSYSIVKLFIAIIPLLGFIGTVLGLSGAIGGFSGALGGSGGGESNINQLMDSLGNVTAGLGTAFDTTLLGLLYSIALMIPSSLLQKIEDDNLNHIDAFCTETLLPRLNDGSNAAGGDMSAFMDAMVIAFNHAQSQYLSGINHASKMIEEQSRSMESRSDENQKIIRDSFAKSVSELSASTKGSIDQMLKNAEESVGKLTGAMTNADKYIGDLGSTVKSAATHVGSLEKNSRDQAQLFQSTMEKSIKSVQEESAKVLKETMKTAVEETSKALDGLVRPTSEQLSRLGQSVEKATKYIEEMERKSSEQQERIQKTLQEAIEKTQRESSRVLEGSMKDAVEQTQKALLEMSSGSAKEVEKLSATVRTAGEQAGNLSKIAQENQSKLSDAIRESAREMQKEASKSVADALRPAVEEIGKLGKSLTEASTQMSDLGRTAKESQEKIGSSITSAVQALQQQTVEATRALQKETVDATRDSLAAAKDTFAQLGDSVKSVSAHLETLSRSSADQQSKLNDGMTKAVSAIQAETQKAVSNSLNEAGKSIGSLSEGIKSLNAILAELGGKTIQVEKKKGGLFG
jgi:biopolymer transport protein ExbB/TolQ